MAIKWIQPIKTEKLLSLTLIHYINNHPYLIYLTIIL